MTTCRLIHTACEPFLYNTLDIYYKPYASHRIKSLASLSTLAMNSHHIRHLKTGLVFTTYLYGALRAYQESQPHGIEGLSAPSSLIPEWPYGLPPADNSCLCVPLPPLTNLTTLAGSFDRTMEAEQVDGSYFKGNDDEDRGIGNNDVEEVKELAMPTAKDAGTCLWQICWFVWQSPWLSKLSLTHYWINNDDDVRLLATTIAGVSSLEQLSLQLVHAHQFDGPNLRQTIFFSAPASLQQLQIHELQARESYCNRESLPNERSRNEWGKYRLGITDMTPHRRQGPMPNLFDLDLFTKVISREFLENIRSMLEHCPALTSFTSLFIGNGVDVGSLAEHVAERCPRIRKLAYRQYREHSTTRSNVFIFALMNALPEQTMETISCSKFDDLAQCTDAVRSIQRHSLTLRTIELIGCDEIQSKIVRTILQECRSLEGLLIWNVAPLHDCSISLEDAVAAIPWACTGIKDLRLVVKIHELYRTMGEHEEYEDDELRPYYERPAPVYLTDFEKEQFSLLERFFRQIGALVDLEVLALQSDVIPEGYEENDGMWGMDTYPGESFPALLSLGDQETGRPGFLGLLASLTRLRRLSGSIEVNDRENSANVGRSEARWLAEQLPILEQAELYNVYTPFDVPTQIAPHMQWLMEQRPALRMWRSFS